MQPALPRLAAPALALAASLVAASSSPRSSGGRVPSTLADFSNPGTQAGASLTPLYSSQVCAACHGYYDQRFEPYERWAASMMGQASRDPIFRAALAIAEQDADFAGDLCWRCHAPNGWLAGRANPTDGSALNEFGDKDGVACHFCHRLVDPVPAAENPPEDPGILAGLADPPNHEVHSGEYVVDPQDRRRGPFELQNFYLHDWRTSPFHREALLCGTCHDVSNPLFERQSDGTYALGSLDRPHPTDDKRDEFPLERTYSEWAASDYARAPIETGGRFGGRRSAVQTCQDCHMPDTRGSAAVPGLGSVRDDLPQHDLNGANSWVLAAIHRSYPESETGLSDPSVERATERNRSMLRRAADLELFAIGGQVIARVVNQGGHKLPSGYGEGRRMWLNLRCFDGSGNLLVEYGAYDPQTADLTPDTRIWRVDHGIAADVAAATGLPQGPSFHFALNSVIEFDNRIPPRGFSNQAFAERGAPVVGASYPDEHYWDEAAFALPPQATRVEATLLHQTTSREYIEFLFAANTTTRDGRIAYELWEGLGKSAPVPMATAELDLASPSAPTPIPYGLAVRAGGGVPPRLGWIGRAGPGGGFALTVKEGPPHARGVLLRGDAPLRTPLPNGGWKLVGGTVVTEAQFTLDGAGGATIPIPIDPGHGGEKRYYQVILRDDASPGGLAASAGLHVELGE